MRRITLLGCAVGLLAAACSSSPETSIDVTTPASVDTAAEQLAPATTVVPSTTSVTAPTGSSTTAVPTTVEPTVSSDAPAAPATNAPATNAPATSPAAPTTRAGSGSDGGGSDDEPIGDGTVPNTNITTSTGEPGIAQSPPIEAGLAPAFFGFSATTTTNCSAADPGIVAVQWEVLGAETVAIAIGTESQIYRLGQPPAGSLDLPLNCVEGSTYFVIAENPAGRTVRSSFIES